MILLMLLSTAAIAQEAEPIDVPFSKEEMTTFVNGLAGCAGLYEAMSIIYREGGRQATAKSMHEKHNGARVSALYLLSVEHRLRTGEAKSLSEFDAYVDGVVETSATYVLSLIEQGDERGLADEVEKCAILHEAQVYIVQLMRDAMIGR